MSDELLEALNLYDDMFPDGFPTIPLAEGKKDEEVIEIIQECIKKKKDVYELGYLSLDEGIIY